ncbi:MAG TPA: hypothetical protein VFW12_01700, partial [Candidatus Limnocylindria bacterium]|nr:hypothetical protein [Candidatus Limnocylindria bacterium]
MPVRAVLPTELKSVIAFVTAATESPDAIVGAVLPTPLARGALVSWKKLAPGVLGLGGRVRAYVEQQRGRVRAATLIYHGRRPEWVVLLMAAEHGPEGADAAFRLLSGVSALAAQHGMHRVFGAVPDEARARETFFQAGFYSYTRESWFARNGPLPEPSRRLDGRIAGGRDAHDLFRFYAMTTPHAVQRAEQLTVEDFDVGRRAGAFDPPHIGGNPLAMRRQVLMLLADERRPRAFAIAYRGTERHPHVCKVRTAEGDVDLARELLRSAALDLAPVRPIAVPVRSYEDHVARALSMEGFGEVATAMLFVKELA